MSSGDVLDCQVQALWCTPSADGAAPVLTVWPEKKEANRRIFLTNAFDTVAALFGGADVPSVFVADISELHRLLYPESSASALEEMLPAKAEVATDEKRLWNLWLQCKSKLDALPAWVLEAISVICRERDEPGLSALFAQEARARSEGYRWFDTFPATVKKVERPDLPLHEDCEPLDPDEVAAFLGPNGSLAKRVPNYEPRPGQIAMLKAVVEAFNEGRHLVVEAGTGIGKSLAYLLPAALWAKLNDVPVVVSTNTKNLQTQLVEKDLPAVLRMMEDYHGGVNDEPLRAAVIKGRTNYLCLRRLGQLLEAGQFELSRDDLRLFAQTLSWAGTTQDGDLDSLLGGASIDPAFAANITCSGEECAGRGCKYHRRCFIQKARERALRANLIVANHSLVFAEIGAEKPISLPVHAQIVFDEAHNLEEAATNFFSQEVSPSRLNTLLRRLSLRRGPKKSQGVLHQLQRSLEKGGICVSEPHHTLMATALDKAVSCVGEIRKAAAVLFEKLDPLVGENDSALRYEFPEPPEGEAPPPPQDKKWLAVREVQGHFRETVLKLLKLLESISDILAEDHKDEELDLVSGELVDLTGVRGLLSEFLDTVDTVLAGSDRSFVYWVQRSHGGPAMGEACAAPINIGEYLAQYLYSKRQSVILCSATLSVAGKFSYIASRLGLGYIDREKIKVCIAPSPFNYIKQCALLLPSYLPEPDAPDRSYEAELSDLICSLAEKYDGRTLCLFTSYRMLKECTRIVEPFLADRGIRLLVHGESGSRNRITNIFRKGDRCVLFGTQSFWEGVDVVGDALSCVVVARLPFASPSDPVISARCEQIDEAGGNSFANYLLPSAVLRLRQGFGRLIRHRDDRGCVVIADTRLTTKNYGRVFLNSLPSPLWRCENAKELLASFDL